MRPIPSAFAAIFVTYLVVFASKLNASYPMIGHDFVYFFPYLIEGKKHFLLQGLSVFRYTAAVCGGMVVQANPQDTFYSLLQLLAIVSNEWIALNISSIIMQTIGFVAWHLFAKRVLKLSEWWSLCFSVVLTASGFYFMHLAVGHVTFHTFPIMGAFLLLLFQRTESNKSALLRSSCIFALLSAMTLQAGGYIVLIHTILTAALFLPIFLLLFANDRKKDLKAFVKKSVCFGSAAAVVCSSKIIAVISFMSNFQRVHPFEEIAGYRQGLRLLYRSMWKFPQYEHLFDDSAFEIWEISSSLSHWVLIGLIASIAMIIERVRQKKIGAPAALLRLYVCLFIGLILLQFYIGKGFFVSPLQNLPVFKSIHVPTRFIQIIQIFLTMGGIFGLKAFFEAHLPEYEKAAAVLVALYSVFQFSFTHDKTTLDQLALTYRYSPNEITSVNAQNTYHVSNVSQNKGQWWARNEYRRLQPPEEPGIIYDHSSTDIHCYEPLFDTTGMPQKRVLYPGETQAKNDGYFNLMNPACYTYPKQNDCEPGDRIRTTDEANMMSFAKGLPVTWKTSLAQRVADLLSLSGLMLMSAFLIVPKRLLPPALKKAEKT